MSVPGAVGALAAKRIVTCDPLRPGVLGVIDDGVVVLDGADIGYVGPRALAPPTTPLVEFGDRVITPGLVDANVHFSETGWIDGRPEPRITQSVTVTIDHDVVDGAPAARFGQTLTRLLEDGAGLDENFAAEAARLSVAAHAVA